MTREVVGKNADKTRQPKSISFDLTDAFEVGLLNYAEDKKHGNFSEFVKRLIARHMDDENRAQPVNLIPHEPDDEQDTMAGFL